jgi:hypothetical protein
VFEESRGLLMGLYWTGEYRREIEGKRLCRN